MHQQNLHLVNFYPDMRGNVSRPILTEHWCTQLCAYHLINSSKTTTNLPVDGFVSVSPARAPIAIGRKLGFHASLMLIGWARLLSSRFSAFSVPFLSKIGFLSVFVSFCQTKLLDSTVDERTLWAISCHLSFLQSQAYGVIEHSLRNWYLTSTNSKGCLYQQKLKGTLLTPPIPRKSRLLAHRTLGYLLYLRSNWGVKFKERPM